MIRRELYPVLAAGIGLPILFSGVGLVLIFGTAAVSTFTCQRSQPKQGNCEVRTLRGPFSWEHRRTYPLADIKSVEVERQGRTGSTEDYYLMMVKTNQGEFSLRSAENPEPLNAEVAKIGEFLADETQSMVQIEAPDDRWILYLIGLIFLTVPTAISARLLWSLLHPTSQSQMAEDQAESSPDEDLFSFMYDE